MATITKTPSVQYNHDATRLVPVEQLPLSKDDEKNILIEKYNRGVALQSSGFFRQVIVLSSAERYHVNTNSLDKFLKLESSRQSQCCITPTSYLQFLDLESLPRNETEKAKLKGRSFEAKLFEMHEQLRPKLEDKANLSKSLASSSLTLRVALAAVALGATYYFSFV